MGETIHLRPHAAPVEGRHPSEVAPVPQRAQLRQTTGQRDLPFRRPDLRVGAAEAAGVQKSWKCLRI